LSGIADLLNNAANLRNASSRSIRRRRKGAGSDNSGFSSFFRPDTACFRSADHCGFHVRDVRHKQFAPARISCSRSSVVFMGLLLPNMQRCMLPKEKTLSQWPNIQNDDKKQKTA
jgi:hypothetical protein